jgi:hypothetical protein
MLYSVSLMIVLSAALAGYTLSMISSKASSALAVATVAPLLHDLQRNQYMLCTTDGQVTQEQLLDGAVVAQDYAAAFFSWSAEVSATPRKSVFLVVESDGSGVITAIRSAYPSHWTPVQPDRVAVFVPAGVQLSSPDLHINVANEATPSSEAGCI